MIISNINIVFLFASISFIIFLYLFKKISLPLNLIDEPNERKKHSGNIPLIGGLTIFTNILIYSFYLNLDYHIQVIIYSSIILLIMGAIDDSIDLRVTYRLIAQLISCLIVIGSGLIIKNIGTYMYFPKIEIGILSIAFTVICVIGLTNAFNFMDGIDGLCAVLLLISIVSIISFSYFLNKTLPYNYEFLIIICISISIFLLFNLSNFFKIFLGDAGSITFGFIVSFLLIFYSQSNIEYIHPVLTIWCVTLIVFDFITVFIKRSIKGVNPFRPDRSHFHHILMRHNLSPIKTLAIIFFTAFFLNMFGLTIFIFFGPTPSLLCFLGLLILYIFININIEKILE